jgi:Cortical protein marker for cell polarity
LTANLTGDNISPKTASVTFTPNIKQSGNYSVTMFTPGCIQDNTCGTRGRVNVTGVMTSGSNGGSTQPFSMELYQSNYYDKYDEIYNGRIDASSGNFKPLITLQPSSGQNGPLTIVAQRLRADLKTNTTGGLNGIYEYNPNQATVQTDFTKSAIDVAGTDLSDDATVNVVIANGNNVYVAGNFQNSKASISSVFSVSDTVKDLGEGGLNGPVQAMTLNNSILYFGGAFNATRRGTTQNLKGVASYNISTSKWSPLGAGINGVATYLVPFNINLTASNKPELAIAVSGTFDSVLAFGNNKAFAVTSFAVWIPGRGNWLQNLNIPGISLKGILTAGTAVPNNPPLLAGSVSSQDLGASGAVELAGTGTSLQQFPVNVQRTSSTASRKRAVASANNNGVVTGTFFIDDNLKLNMTIYGGHFTAAASNGSVINNLLIINGSNNDAITGLAGGVNSDSTVQTFGIQGTSLFTGGRISGNVNGKDVKGMIVYDLRASNYASIQPAALQGSSVVVNAIAPQPSTSLIYVGGSFDSAGSFSCPSLCVYDTTRGQWNSPGNGLTGAVAAMTWVDNTHLVLVGNLSVNGNTSTVVRYDSKASSFAAIGGPSGSITTLTPASSDGTQLWVTGSNTDGTPLLQKYDGTKWTAVQPSLGAGSTIQGLQVFSTTQNHAASTLLDKNNALLVLGQLNVPNFGNASGALFNGTAWTPYLLSVSNTGSGSMSQVFVEKPANFFKTSGKSCFLPTSAVC